MTRVALVRHGPTDWNAERRLQGRADRVLSPEGRAEVEMWSVPEDCLGFEWVSSPLLRARQTAEILGLAVSRIEHAITEMDWGDWDGHTRCELEEIYGNEVAVQTARGLDMRPHNGESPRELRSRVSGWLLCVAERCQPTGAVCHQGIIRAVLSLATGWNMIGKPPLLTGWNGMHLFDAKRDGTVEVVTLNVCLTKLRPD